MSLIDVACRSVLVANAAVTALVGQRIYPEQLPVGATLPALTFSLISDVQNSQVSSDWRARVQISCWSDPPEHNGIKSPAEVESVAGAVISALSRTALEKQVRAWTVGSNTYSVLSCRCSNSPRHFENDTKYYHKPCDFIIKYRM